MFFQASFDQWLSVTSVPRTSWKAEQHVSRSANTAGSAMPLWATNSTRFP
jgi:hypothetical protein